MIFVFAFYKFIICNKCCSLLPESGQLVSAVVRLGRIFQKTHQNVSKRRIEAGKNGHRNTKIACGVLIWPCFYSTLHLNAEMSICTSKLNRLLISLFTAISVLIQRSDRFLAPQKEKQGVLGLYYHLFREAKESCAFYV